MARSRLLLLLLLLLLPLLYALVATRAIDATVTSMSIAFDVESASGHTRATTRLGIHEAAAAAAESLTGDDGLVSVVLVFDACRESTAALRMSARHPLWKHLVSPGDGIQTRALVNMDGRDIYLTIGEHCEQDAAWLSRGGSDIVLDMSPFSDVWRTWSQARFTDHMLTLSVAAHDRVGPACRRDRVPEGALCWPCDVHGVCERRARLNDIHHHYNHTAIDYALRWAPQTPRGRIPVGLYAASGARGDTLATDVLGVVGGRVAASDARATDMLRQQWRDTPWRVPYAAIGTPSTTTSGLVWTILPDNDDDDDDTASLSWTREEIELGFLPYHPRHDAASPAATVTIGQWAIWEWCDEAAYDSRRYEWTCRPFARPNAALGATSRALLPSASPASVTLAESERVTGSLLTIALTVLTVMVITSEEHRIASTLALPPSPGPTSTLVAVGAMMRDLFTIGLSLGAVTLAVLRAPCCFVVRTGGLTDAPRVATLLLAGVLSGTAVVVAALVWRYRYRRAADRDPHRRVMHTRIYVYGLNMLQWHGLAAALLPTAAHAPLGMLFLVFLLVPIAMVYPCYYALVALLHAIWLLVGDTEARRGDALRARLPWIAAAAGLLLGSVTLSVLLGTTVLTPAVLFHIDPFFRRDTLPYMATALVGALLTYGIVMLATLGIRTALVRRHDMYSDNNDGTTTKKKKKNTKSR